jgi:hypothetical protein
LLQCFTGEKLPILYDEQKTFRKKNRMFLDELKESDLKELLSYFETHKESFLQTAFLGLEKELEPHYLVCIQGSDLSSAKFINMSKVLSLALNGPVELTPRGSLKIGKVTLQRKGGDGGRESAKDLQMKIKPKDFIS